MSEILRKKSMKLVAMMSSNQQTALKNSTNSFLTSSQRAHAQGMLSVYDESIDLLEAMIETNKSEVLKAQLLSTLVLGLKERHRITEELDSVVKRMNMRNVEGSFEITESGRASIVDTLLAVIDVIKLPEDKKDNWIEKALELFPNARQMTAEESANYEASLDKLYEPTGRNFFDSGLNK